MEREGIAFDRLRRRVQKLGYAEALIRPSTSRGHDTAQEAFRILASLAFGIKVDESAVYVEGISSIAPEDLDAADELGYRVKLLGVAMRTDKGIEQRVHPTMIPKDSAIAQVMGVTNAVSIDADGFAPITLVGPGAGGQATASAVVADIGDIARGVRTPPFGRPSARLATSKRAPMQRHEWRLLSIRLHTRRSTGPAPSRRSPSCSPPRRFRSSRLCSAIVVPVRTAATTRRARPRPRRSSSLPTRPPRMRSDAP